jgi:oxygen-dependent protoporphyrinogen oxidase
LASIVVVGGGIAGLTCAWQLRRAGNNVDVLEKADCVGGRLRAETRDGFILDWGASQIRSGDRGFRDLATKLGISGQLRRVGGTGDVILRNGVFAAADLQTPTALFFSPLLSAAAKLRLLGLGAELAWNWRNMDPRRPERMVGLDRGNLAAVLRRIVGEECVEHLFEPSFRASYGCALNELSWPFGLLAMQATLRAGRPVAFEGGMGGLTSKLAESLPVRRDCEVQHIETETAGVRIHYRQAGREGRVVADAVVLAVPGCEVATLCPKLTPDERGFFEEVRYTRGIAVSMMLARAPRTLSMRRVAFPRPAGLGLSELSVENHKPGYAPAGAGLLRALLTPSACDRKWHVKDTEIAGYVAEELARTPIGRLEIRDTTVRRITSILPIFHPGYFARLARFNQRLDRSPRIAFAGDYLIGPSVEGAITSGMRAANEIGQDLRASAG